jgi:uncharacterized protein YdaU (DUF1376 family)
MHYYSHHVGDYHRDTAHLSILEHGVYRLLMDSYYSTERPLPSDHTVLCRIVRAVSKAERDAVAMIAASFFTNDGGMLKHNRIERELEVYHIQRQQCIKAGKASAAKRNSVTKGQRAFNGRSTGVDSPLEQNGNGEANESPTNQEPVTINQEPLTKKEKKPKAPKLSDDEWMASLKSNPEHEGKNIDAEFRRASEWVSKQPDRKMSRRFFENWLERCEKPLTIKPKPKPPESCLGHSGPWPKGHSFL